MKAKIIKTGESVEVRPHADGWYIDESGDNVYREDELELEDDVDMRVDPFMLGSLIMKSHVRENILDWRQKRFDLVQQLIDIYQAPATNMDEIIALADRYIKALMESER